MPVLLGLHVLGPCEQLPPLLSWSPRCACGPALHEDVCALLTSVCCKVAGPAAPTAPRGSPAPLVPVGPDFPNYLSVNADEELTRDRWGLASPDLWAELMHVAPWPCSSSGRGGVSGRSRPRLGERGAPGVLPVAGPRKRSCEPSAPWSLVRSLAA